MECESNLNLSRLTHLGPVPGKDGARMSKLLRFLPWAIVPLAIVVVVAFVFLSWPTGSDTEIPLSQLVGLAVEGRVQEIRVQEISGKSASGSSQVRFTALLDDGSEVIGRAENSDAFRIALEQAGVADVDGLFILE